MKKINKNIFKLFSNKLVERVLIPFLLILFWIICSIVFNRQVGFSVLEYPHSYSLIIQKPEGKLLKGKKIEGEFIAKNNFLGILFLRFNRYVKPDYHGEDVLSFKLKEKGSGDWYYYNNYRSGSLENNLIFPFGFPIIDNSKGKTYQFEIDSLFGNETNAVQLSSNNPILITAYQLPKQEIFSSKKRIMGYLFDKTLTSFTSLDFIFNSTIFLLPLLLYLFWRFLFKNLQAQKQIFSIIIMCLIFLDIFILKEVYAGILLGLIILWLISIKIYRLENSVSFLVCFIFIIIWLVLFYLGVTIYSDKLNIWAYTFLAIGALQIVLEEKNKSKNLINYKDFLSGFFKFSKIN